MTKPVLILVATLAIVAACANQPSTPVSTEAPSTVPVERGDVKRTVSASGTLIGTRRVTLSSSVSGRLTELNVRPGDAVKAGEVLAALDTSELELKARQAEQVFLKQHIAYSQTVQPDPDAIQSAQLVVSHARAAYDAARSAYDLRDDQIAANCLGLANAEDALAQAQAAFDSVANDWKAKKYEIYEIRRQMLENAQTIYDLARANCSVATIGVNDASMKSALAQWQQAQAQLNDLLSPPAEKALAAQIDLERARLELEQARRDLSSAAIVAPFDGVVVDVKARLGEPVAANSPLIVVTDPKSVEAETAVAEEDWPLVKSGQPVDLFFDARPDAEVTGVVARRVPKRTAGDRPQYPVYVAINDLPDGLASGMTLDASIVIDIRSDVLRLPRALVRARSDGTGTVKVWTGDRIEERQVKVGLRGNLYVEILEGLSEGEQVVGE